MPLGRLPVRCGDHKRNDMSSSPVFIRSMMSCTDDSFLAASRRAAEVGSPTSTTAPVVELWRGQRAAGDGGCGLAATRRLPRDHRGAPSSSVMEVIGTATRWGCACDSPYRLQRHKQTYTPVVETESAQWLYFTHLQQQIVEDERQRIVRSPDDPHKCLRHELGTSLTTFLPETTKEPIPFVMVHTGGSGGSVRPQPTTRLTGERERRRIECDRLRHRLQRAEEQVVSERRLRESVTQAWWKEHLAVAELFEHSKRMELMLCESHCRVSLLSLLHGVASLANRVGLNTAKSMTSAVALVQASQPKLRVSAQRASSVTTLATTLPMPSIPKSSARVRKTGRRNSDHPPMLPPSTDRPVSACVRDSELLRSLQRAEAHIAFLERRWAEQCSTGSSPSAPLPSYSDGVMRTGVEARLDFSPQGTDLATDGKRGGALEAESHGALTTASPSSAPSCYTPIGPHLVVGAI